MRRNAEKRERRKNWNGQAKRKCGITEEEEEEKKMNERSEEKRISSSANTTVDGGADKVRERKARNDSEWRW